MKVIWLDDYREPQQFLYTCLDYKPEDIVICKNYEDFVDKIEKDGLPEMVCFDHDLGEDKTGYDACKWLINYCYERKLSFPAYYIQSANAVGAMNIDQAIKGYNLKFS